jgi:hypothetical protein
MSGVSKEEAGSWCSSSFRWGPKPSGPARAIERPLPWQELGPGLAVGLVLYIAPLIFREVPESTLGDILPQMYLPFTLSLYENLNKGTIMANSDWPSVT